MRDLDRALAHYASLGFTTRRYGGGGYGFAERDGVELHLGVVPEDAAASPSNAYLFVEDPDRLAAAWSATGADVRTPVDTEWGQYEGVVIDPDGNIIRFGSPMSRPIA